MSHDVITLSCRPAIMTKTIVSLGRAAVYLTADWFHLDYDIIKLVWTTGELNPAE